MKEAGHGDVRRPLPLHRTRRTHESFEQTFQPPANTAIDCSFISAHKLTGNSQSLSVTVSQSVSGRSCTQGTKHVQDTTFYLANTNDGSEEAFNGKRLLEQSINLDCFTSVAVITNTCSVPTVHFKHKLFYITQQFKCNFLFCDWYLIPLLKNVAE